MGSSCCKNDQSNRFAIRQSMLSKTASLNFYDPIANNWELQEENHFKKSLNQHRFMQIKGENMVSKQVMDGLATIIKRNTKSCDSRIREEGESISYQMKIDSQSSHEYKRNLLSSKLKEISVSNSKIVAETAVNEISDTKFVESMTGKTNFHKKEEESKKKNQKRKFQSLCSNKFQDNGTETQKRLIKTDKVQSPEINDQIIEEKPERDSLNKISGSDFLL